MNSALRISLGAFLLLLLAALTLAAEALRPGDTVAVCGDSITEQKLYSVFIEDYLLMCQPAANLRSHQFGWSGEAAPGLLRRLDTQVLPFAPTVATTFYGMNDGGYTTSNPATVAAFRDQTEAIVQKLHAGGVRFILVGSPGAVDTEKFKTWRLAKCSPDAYNQTLADLGSAAQLAAGVNLAAEFLDNPFHASFARVDAAVKAQQTYETPAVKTLLPALATGPSLLPEEQETFSRLRSATIAKAGTLGAEARRAIKPVRHTLEILPLP